MYVLPAVTSRTDAGIAAPDFAHDFLDRCVEAAKQEDNYLRTVYLEEYSMLVKYIGGTAMSEETDKKILRNILASGDSIQTMRDLSEVWGNRSSLIPKVIFDEIKKIPGFHGHPDEPEMTVFKKIDDEVGIGFSKERSLGYVYSGDTTLEDNKLVNRLQELINQVSFPDWFSSVQHNHVWVYRDLEGERVDVPLDDMIQQITTVLGELEKVYI